MKRALLSAAGLALVVASVPAWAAEPLLGTWRLDSQEVNGQKSNSEPLTLKVTQAGDKLAFAFSVPVNNVYFVSMTYTAKNQKEQGLELKKEYKVRDAITMTSCSMCHR